MVKPTQPASTAGGFTLVELLVVLFIIALSSGLVLMSSGQPGSRVLDSSAVQFRQFTAGVSEMAQRRSERLGVLLMGRKMQLLHFTEGRWQTLQPEKGSQASIPSLEFDDSIELNWAGRGRLARPGTSLQPEIVFFPNGEASPFALRLAQKQAGPRTLELKSDGIQLLINMDSALHPKTQRPDCLSLLAGQNPCAEGS